MLLVGMGAVSTTFIAGTLLIRKGLAPPIGSLAEMGTVRLGKRTEGRSPLIKDFVPLAGLDDLVFGAWDIFEENGYEAAMTAGVLDASMLEQVRPELEAIRPWPAVFDQRYVKRLMGTNVKTGANKREIAEQVRADICAFKDAHHLDRLVMIWCGSTEIFMTPTAAQRDTVRKLKDGIETHRAARRRLGSWMKMLGSKTRSEVRAAQNQLRRDPDTAIPLLIEAVRNPGKPVLVKNTLEMLRRLRRPEIAIPELVGVLGRTGQQANWPDAVRELSQLKDPGAGPLLLKLLNNAKPPEQRAAALAALSGIPDPPPETLLVLLPVLHTDGAALEPALHAAHTAMTRHGQPATSTIHRSPPRTTSSASRRIAITGSSPCCQ